jgi:YVTN family beta-propeller protein
MSTRVLVAAALSGFSLAALVSAHHAAADTAYVANEATSTISVIDTATSSVVATICLGSDPAIPGTPQPAGPCNGETQHHNPFYNGHVDPHGLWLTPDGSVLLVAARISGTIVAIDTATNNVLGYTPVGREPHLATVHPSGREAWVAVRGESYIDILKLDRDDLFNSARRRTDRMEIVDTIDTMRGPSMVSFTSDGRFAFVAAGKQARVDKIDAVSRQIVASQAVPAAFTPFGLVTPDSQELYLVHKGAGSLSILRTQDLAFLTSGMPIGPRANHVFFVGNLAYITIGGAAPSAGNPDPEGEIVILDRAKRAIVNRLTGPAFNGDPHGIWASSEGKLFVTHERGNRVTVIRTNNPNDPSDDTIEGTVGGSAADLAFMKRLIDVVIRP